jgi:hypothetical protein
LDADCLGLVSHSKNTQIDRTMGLMELNKLVAFEDLRETLSELASCMWKLDAEGQVTDEIAGESRYHCLAALRYICSDFNRDTEIRQKPKISGHALC